MQPQAEPRLQKKPIPDGRGARLGMFSVREGPLFEKFRRVYEILREHNYDVLLVDVRDGDDEGSKTCESLARLHKEKGALLAVCSANYGEVTSSKYSSFEVLKFSHGWQLPILPLSFSSEIYPPEPPHGPAHPYDSHGDAMGLVLLAMDSLRPLQCHDDDHNIAKGIAKYLRGQQD